MDQSGITFRELHTHAEYQECVTIQKETWGKPFTEVVCASILMISQKVGGIVAGAFDAQGRMVGFVFGLTGIRNRKPVHWSHMLAVRNDVRGSGLGQELKWFQRDLLLKRGVDVMFWTFDPLVSRNAHLNLNRLGARIDSYAEDYYGADSDSELHSGLGTDRFIAVWRLKDARVKKLASRADEAAGADKARSAYAETPVVSVATPDAKPLPMERIVRVEVPGDIQVVKKVEPETAWRWRTVTRRAFGHYLQKGYEVETIYRDAAGRSYYVMTKGRIRQMGRRGTRGRKG